MAPVGGEECRAIERANPVIRYESPGDPLPEIRNHLLPGCKAEDLRPVVMAIDPGEHRRPNKTQRQK